MSPLLRLYLLFSHVAGPLWRLNHRKRLKKGKELPERLGEKYGQYTDARPSGQVLWFHALSVGESLALVPLIERALADLPQAHVVLITSTATSAEALGKAGLPERCTHILLPIDTPRACRAFLTHWRPDLAAFSELDFWPRLMVETSRRNIPMILINSRLPEKSLQSRKRMHRAMGDILALFDHMLVQDVDSYERFRFLGANKRKISVVGALKSAARPLPADEHMLGDFRERIGARPVWLAAATWESEHAPIIEAHKRVAAQHPDTLLIIAPRHIRDGKQATEIAKQSFEQVGQRSEGELPGLATQVYVADTIGEMGLWYRLASVSFVGHSLDVKREGLEGKNPFEAASLGSVILHGPSVSYFSESYQALAAAGASCEVGNAQTLASEVIRLLDADARAPMLAGAKQVIAARRGVLENTWAILRRALD